MKFVPVQKSEFSDVFAVVKQGLFEHVDSVFGWDDDYQLQRLKSEYDLSWFQWVYSNSQKVGLICFKPYDDAYHIHLLLVFPEYRQQMYGKAAMIKVQDFAFKENCKRITLSSFSRNSAALSFYKQLGYEVVESEKDFVSLSLELAL
ncbi:GNAT family N-acetyltransferase [Vibrio toranzoniae]|uniref:GNAT family N-acetyltransferase n=1 Tax=Vibrio toranzoniae TaxID=1194427 RepID=UPI001929E44E|nr:GNAT family N-acetyltransferase [Vibrio toranzoniae]